MKNFPSLQIGFAGGRDRHALRHPFLLYVQETPQHVRGIGFDDGIHVHGCVVHLSVVADHHHGGMGSPAQEIPDSLAHQHVAHIEDEIRKHTVIIASQSQHLLRMEDGRREVGEPL